MNGEIGVLICSFAGGKSGSIDTRSLAKFARGLKGVAWSKVFNQLCEDTTRPEIVSALKAGEVDRFVVAACSPMVQERRLMSIAVEAGLNPSMFTVANVREQSALVHSPDDAQKKAELLLSMAVAKCSLLAPASFDRRIPESRVVVVLGDGIRAAVAANSIAARGMKAEIVAPSTQLRMPLLVGEEIARSLKIRKAGHLMEGEIVDIDGAPGAFELLVEGNETRAMRCGAIVVAFDPEPLDGMMAAKSLEEALKSGKISGSIAIVADSWDPTTARPPFDIALKAATRWKSARDDSQVVVVVRDIHAGGAMEEQQREAQNAGVRFIRSEEAPSITIGAPSQVAVVDQVLGPLSFFADTVADLRSGRNEVCARACSVLGIATRPDGTPKEAKVRLEAGESLKAGVFVLDPWNEWCNEDIVLDARAIASRIEELLGSAIEEGGAIAQVEEGKCSACLTCVRICPYGAPRMNDDMKAAIKFELCQGCGMCVTACPSKAIDMHCYSDQQLATEAHAALGGRR